MKIVFFREVKKKMKNKKKAFILAGMAVLLVLTGFLNYKLNNASDVIQETATQATASSFFETYRNDRTLSRESQVELLNEIINSEYATEAEKSTAIASKSSLQSKMETELILEGLVKAKGFDDAVVTVGSNYYNVIVKDDGNLGNDQINQILSVIIGETGTTASNIKIIPVE